MPRIVSVATAVPAHELAQEASMAMARHFFQDAFPDINRLLTVFSHSQIRKRHFCMPADWFFEEHGFAEKNRLYVEHAVALGAEAAARCLERGGSSPSDIDCLLFVSSTGLSTPSIDACLLNRLGMRPDIARIPLWGLGCAGGAMGLARASEYVRAYPEKRALLVCVELCGLTFIRNDRSKSNLIATCLFGDGAAAALVEGDAVPRGHRAQTELSIVRSESRTWPDTLDVMGWELTDDGLKVIFSRDIPQLISASLRENIDRFLSKGDAPLSEVNRFLFHPGGAKVLAAYQKALELSEGATRFSADVLREYGNMSSPTVLFVLEKSLEHPWRAGEKGLLAALGPGFSSELLLLEAR